MIGPAVERLRRQLLAGLGLTLAACSSADPPTAEEAGVTTDPSGDGSTSDDESSEPANPSTTSSATDESDSESDSSSSSSSSESSEGESEADDLPPGPVLDFPTPLGDCTVTAADTTLLDSHPECPQLDPNDSCGLYVYVACVAPEPGQTCERLCPEGDCVEDWTNCEGDPQYEVPSAVCGPFEIDGQCCSIGQFPGFCSDGRPFMVDERSRVAAIVGSARVDDERLESLPADLRERLATRWLEIAAAEHASIASFARFTAQLAAHGAPPALIRDALAAAGDEVRHAELALALASGYSGRALDFGRLDARGAFDAPLDLEALVRACVHEGCIGETIAALELAVAAEHCEDPQLAATLAAIAEDEARHAGLAWRFVQWALARRPGLRTAIAESFAARVVERGEPESLAANEREFLRARGCLPADERRDVHASGVAQLLAPCAAALLAA
ncbi:ferritin-like domain-containing protein [Nannocystaceae bacterium ST9]